MIKAMWHSFPRLIEQNVNALLDTAEPSNKKAFMLYKSCKREELWLETYETFLMQLTQFYSRPKAHRKKSQLDQFLQRPMQSDLYADFHLNFRTAYIPEQALFDVASWAYNLIRVAKRKSLDCASLDVMTKTLIALTSPGPFDKAENLDFEDFCAVWKKTVFKIFGFSRETEMRELVSELEWMNSELKAQEELIARNVVPAPTIELTPMEADWVSVVREAAIASRPAPDFPLKEGPSKKELVELGRIVALYKKSRTTKVDEVIRQKEKIRATLLFRCNELLRPIAHVSGF